MRMVLRGGGSMTDTKAYPLGDYLYKVRRDRDISIRELCRLIEKNPAAGTTVSNAYYSQVETGSEKVKPEKISFDFFWAVASVLKVDPVHLFILSRQAIPQEYIERRKRDFLFNIE